jgi:hypothetical protein
MRCESKSVIKNEDEDDDGVRLLVWQSERKKKNNRRSVTKRNKIQIKKSTNKNYKIIVMKN